MKKQKAILKRMRSRSIDSETVGQGVWHTCVNTVLSLVLSGPAGLGRDKDDPCVESSIYLWICENILWRNENPTVYRPVVCPPWV